jgi:hypothetical protein
MSEMQALHQGDRLTNWVKPMLYLTLSTLWFMVIMLRVLTPDWGQRGLEGVVLFLIALSSLIMAGLGVRHAHSLAECARVLGQRQVPRAYWRRWQLASLKETSMLWGIALIGVVTLVLPSHRMVNWVTASALVSASLTVSTLWTLAQQRLLPSWWQWCLAVASLTGLLAISLGSIHLADVLESIHHLPGLLLLPIMASWPLLVAVLMRQWANQPPQAREGSCVSPGTLWESLRAYSRRYTPLQFMLSGTSATPVRTATSFGPFWSITFLVCLMASNRYFFELKAGDSFGTWQLLGLGCLVGHSLVNLVCKDLHWRWLLAPGGLRPGRLGQHIFLSTLAYWYAVLLAIVVVAWFLACTVFGASTDAFLNYVLRFELLPLHLCFAVSVGTCVRGLPYPMRWVVGIFVVWLIYAASSVWKLTAELGAAKQAGWFTAGPEYVGTLLAFSALAIVLANRVWTVDKLIHGSWGSL